MGGPLSFLLQKHFSILVLKYIKRQRGGGMNDFSQKQFSHHTVTHFNTDPPLVRGITQLHVGGGRKFYISHKSRFPSGQMVILILN